MKRAVLTTLVLAACGGDPYVVVTVNARPAVTGADSLTVTLQNAGATRTDVLELDGRTFPVTFSVDPSGRSGTLGITVEADAMGSAVGLGSSTIEVGDKKATVLVDTVDFVVNTDFSMDHFLSMNYEANGLQLATDSNGVWSAGFRDNCNGTDSCNVYGRRFNADGTPQSTVAADGTNQFLLTTDLTYEFTTAAVATTGSTTLVVWDFQETVGSPPATGVACRALDGSGDPGQGQLQLGSDAATSVSIATLSNGTFAVAWEIGAPPTAAIRTVITQPDCTAVGSVTTVSTTEGTTTGPATADVAANGSAVLYAWITDGNVYVRPASNTGPSGTADIKLISATADYEASSVRLAPLGSGFGLVLRSVNPSGMGAGKIELFQLGATGSLANPTAQLITDQSASDFASGQQATGVATRASDGELLIVWHVCDGEGDPTSCQVFGQQASSDGALVGGTFNLSTSPKAGQAAPSVTALPDGSFAAAWNDASDLAPVTSGYAVRARILYPDAGSGLGSGSGG